MLDPDWWAFGLALHERGTANHAGDVIGDAARQRLAKWRARYGNEGQFAERLAEAGLTPAELGKLLGESPASLARRVTRPEWVAVVEHAVRNAGVLPTDVPQANVDWRDCFALPLRPFVTIARDRLNARAGHILDPGYAILPDIVAAFGARLSRRLVRVAARTLVHEFTVDAGHGRLEGGGHQRLVSFARMLSEPASLARLVTKYPVLGRLLGQASRFAADTHLELLRRFAADRATIVDTILDGVDPGPIVAIQTGLGDAHRYGRTVAKLLFAGGAEVVYKPRDLRSHGWFSAIVRWLNGAVPELGLRTVTALVRPGYGWLEHVPHQPLENLDAADRFYTRLGALLALLHVVQASDIHNENLIACGDQPMVIDLETVFHPRLSLSGKAADPAGVALAGSVQRTGLLPAVIVGQGGVLDMSGLGGRRGQVSASTAIDWDLLASGEMRPVRRLLEFGGSQNHPHIGSVELDPLHYEEALLEGFRIGYDAIMRHRRVFAELVATGADIEVRAVVRHTRGYESLLSDTTDPSLLEDALERDQALDLLWTESAHPTYWRLCQHEQADLWCHDIPLFSARPDSVDVWTSDGRRLPGLLDRPPLDNIVDKLGALTEADRRDQEWIISASLATQLPPGRHDRAEPMAGSLAAVALPPDRVLATACELADRIAAHGIADGHRVNWVGLEPVEEQHWMVLPMGAGLGNGYLGVALFLAQLADLSGKSRYADLARQAIQEIPRLYATFATQPELVAVVGCGGLHGFGGVAYGLARLATLLADEDVRGWTGTAVELAAIASDSSQSPGWATGLAGCLAAMTAVHADVGLSQATELASSCARRLAALVSDEPALARRLPQGFANGVNGIGWALARFAATGGDAAHARAAQHALFAEEPADVPPTNGWCSGLAGNLVAQAGLPDRRTDRAHRDLVRDMLTERPLLQDLSLCHGELGISDALIALTDGISAAAQSHRAGLIVEAINQFGPSCGTPGAVPTPGLLSGLSGIGYGLLRLGFPEQVPSVLLLEPTPVKSMERNDQ